MSELTKALIKAKAKFKPIKRSAEVKVAMRGGGSYTFNYAPLDEMKESTEKPLADEGLVVLSLRDGDVLVTRLMHTSGEMVESRSNMRIRDGASQQDEGSIRSYQERYNYAGILGLCVVDDDDANIADGNSFEKKAEANKKPAAEPKKGKFKFLDDCKRAKAFLGNEMYYQILGNAGFEKSIEVSKQADMDTIIGEMALAAEEKKKMEE